MKTISDLGRRIKAKYPGEYDDLTDEEVGRKVRAKYPGEYDDFIDYQTESNIQSVIEYYKPNRGRLTAWWQRGKAEGRGKLLDALNLEQQRVVEQGAILESAVLQGQKTFSDHELFIAQNQSVLLELQHKEVLIQQAAQQGYSVEVDQEIKKRKALSEIDIENRWKEIIQDLNAADLVQMGDHQLLQKEREYLAGEVRARYALLSGSDTQPVKDELVIDMNQHIQFLKDRINARQARLLSPEDGQETKRLEEGAPVSSGLTPEETEADTE
jgi:hypothetical protein